MIPLLLLPSVKDYPIHKNPHQTIPLISLAQDFSIFPNIILGTLACPILHSHIKTTAILASQLSPTERYTRFNLYMDTLFSIHSGNVSMFLIILLTMSAI